MKILYKKSTLILFFLFLVCYQLSAQISVTATIGNVSGNYFTLKTAFDNINTGIHRGVITIKVHSNTTETATVLVDSSGNATGSNYTSILIRPTDTATVVKTISTSLAGVPLITFNGSDNITIDGRPLSLGQSKLLTFNHNGTTASSHTFNLANGVTQFITKYTNFNNATNSAIVTGNILLSTSVAPVAPNANILITNCKIQGARAGIYLSGTATNLMDNIEIRNNEIVNFANAGILSTTGSFKNLTIDSNIIYQTTNSLTAPTGIDIRHNAIGTQLIITRNSIFDMQTATTNFIRGIVVSPATTLTGTTILVANNYISLMQNGGSGANIRGFEFGGAGDVVCNFINNSVRIGGTHVGGTAGGVVSLGILKSNTAAASTWICKNNIAINERTGGTTGIFHTAAWVSGNGTSLVGNYDIDYNVYNSIGTAGSGPFSAVWNGTLYGDITGYLGASTPFEQHSKYNTVNFTSNTNLTLAGNSVNNYAVMNCPRSALVLNDIFNTVRGSLTYKGAHQSTPFSNLKDASVQEVYSLGKLPIPYANLHFVRANILNAGLDTLFNQKVKLDIAGNNLFADSVFVDTIAPGISKNVTFSGYNYNNLGAGTVTISVPNDSTNSNNSKVFNQIITSGTYSYANPTLPAAGGVGFNGVGGDFIAKFPYTGFNFINQVGVNFNTGGQPFQIVIYEVLNDTPGTILWNSATTTAVTGINTINVNPVLAVSGSFFVGVRQIGTTNVGFGYQVEDPIRDKTFFYKANSVNNWIDFASSNSAFRFMVEPRLQVANDIGMASVNQPCAAVLAGGAPISPQFTITNYGLNNQSNFTVKSSITGPTNLTSNDVISSTVLSGASYTFNTNSLFNPTTVGTYTVKVWTELAGDLEPNNDTITYTFSVANTSTTNTSLNGLNFNGAGQYLQANGAGTLNVANDKLTLEAWVNTASLVNDNYILSKNLNAFIGQYSLYINTSGKLICKIATVLFEDSVVSSSSILISTFTHVAAVYDGNTIKIYINGALEGTKNLIGNILGNGRPLLIGSAYGGGSFINGTLDEIKIWDTCRTADQIRRNMHTRLPNSASTSLKAYYRLDENVGNYFIDASGNCNNASAINSALFITTNIPLGTPIVVNNVFTNSGSQLFSGTDLSINIFNNLGTSDIYVHKFSDSAIVTSPVVSPGGVTATLGKYWVINRYEGGGMDSCEITFNVKGILNTATNSDFKLFTRDYGVSNTWNITRSAANSFNTTAQSITMKIDETLFNRQFILGAINNPLPVKLVSFIGTLKNSSAVLYWTTSIEINNTGFSVERSLNGKDFTEIGFVKGAINSNKLIRYGFNDINIFNNNSIAYYRLKQIDINGKFEYSKIIVISNKNESKNTIEIYPNPFTNTLSMNIETYSNTNAQLTIYNVTGQKVYEMNLLLNEGFNSFNIDDTSKLSNGAYFINISSEGNMLYNGKLIKTN